MPIERPRAYSYIRMSTPEQLKGHSKRRQLEKSIEYARAHDLEFADESQIEDIGVSAFRGANVKYGALGQFIAAVEVGRVPAGSYLLVESLDRISRQEILLSLELFVKIIRLGIILVTLQDEKVFTPNMDVGDLIVSLTILSRANEESELKSKRLRDAWARERAKATSEPLTAWCPGWLELKDGTFERLDKRVTTVRTIYKDAVSGLGILAIARHLNERKTPVFGKSNRGWHPSYIAKILSNRAVLGEFQPFTTHKGTRVAVGEPIKDYFPRIIDDELFYRAQQAKANRRNSGSGRKGDYFTNLFSGFATCWYCRSPMRILNKGSPPKGGKYLVCSAAQAGLGCVRTRWRYDHFETSFLRFVEQVNLPTLIDDDDSERARLDETLRAIEGQKLATEQQMEKTYGLLQAADIPFVAEKLKTLQQRLQMLEEQRNGISGTLESRQSVRDAFYQADGEIKPLIKRLQDQTAKREDVYKLRAQVADRMKAIAEEVEVAAEGGDPLMEGRIEYINPKRVSAERRGMFTTERFFLVTFKDYSTLGVIPPDDPFSVEQYQVFETSEPSSVTQGDLKPLLK
jgi:DNA invertase Pin-like site-specific DNA recombinase